MSISRRRRSGAAPVDGGNVRAVARGGRSLRCACECVEDKRNVLILQIAAACCGDILGEFGNITGGGAPRSSLLRRGHVRWKRITVLRGGDILGEFGNVTGGGVRAVLLVSRRGHVGWKRIAVLLSKAFSELARD